MSSWNFIDVASKDNLLALIQREAEGMFALVDSDEKWTAPTGAGHWEARDVIGHLVDTTETYFVGWEAARGTGDGPDPVPLTDMAEHVDAGAQALRDIPRTELIDRCEAALAKHQGLLEELTDEEWGSLMIPHKYMGPLPAFFYAVFQLVDYAVHSWDIREGTGKPHSLAGDSADMLVPVCYVLWSATPKGAPESPYQVGITITSGENAGDSVVSVGDEGVNIEPGDVGDLPAVIEFDPANFVLTAYGRFNSGTIRGDFELANQFLNSFYRI